MKGPRQPIPGTRRHRCRCSLPGLTGFTADRRGVADADRGNYPCSCRRKQRGLLSEELLPAFKPCYIARMSETHDPKPNKIGAVLLVVGVAALLAYAGVFLPWYDKQQPVTEEELEDLDRRLADTTLELQTMLDDDLSVRQLADERERENSDLGQALSVRCLQWTDLNDSRQTAETVRFQQWACKRYNHYVTSGELLPDEPPDDFSPTDTAGANGGSAI